jgi:plasmid stabilization system protein ParE
VAQVKYAARAWDDLERICEFHAEEDPQRAARIVSLITGAVDILAEHPLIGRRAEEGLRELVVSHGRSGFLALYRFRETEDLVTVLAIRHQQEAGYTR